MKENFTIDDLQDLWHKVTLLHKGQTYGGERENEKIEYINHIGGVVFEIFNAIDHSDNFDGKFAIKCAMLHDSIEDTAFTADLLKEEFGDKVAAGVLALTKNTTLDRGLQMADSLERIKLQPKEVWAVKLADRICNLYRPPYYWDNKKKQRYLDEAEVIYTQLKDGNDYLAMRLRDKIEKYKEYIK